MKKIILLLTILVGTRAFAAQGAFFVPDSDSARDCARLGFAGPFSLVVDPRYSSIAEIVFEKSKSRFTVFRDRGNIWRMVINGSLSESITVDFQGRTLSYSSSRQGKAGVCRGRF